MELLSLPSGRTLVLGLLHCFFPYAYGQTDMANLSVGADVVSACEVTLVENIDFGKTTFIIAAPIYANGSVTVRCTKGTQYSIYIDGNRQMVNGENTIQYELFKNSARSEVWGDTAPTGLQTTSQSSTPVTYDVYAEVPIQQPAAVGQYSNTNTITLEWQ